MIEIAAFVLGGIGALVFAGWFFMEVVDADSILGKIFGSMFSLFVAAICGFLFVLATVGTANIFIPKEIKMVSQENVNLRALDTGDKVSGRFFLGSGYVGQEKVFEYITQDKDGGMRVTSSPVSMSVIYERDTETPQMTIWHYEESNQWLSYSPVKKFDNYSFVIPKGSVKADYAVSVGK